MKVRTVAEKMRRMMEGDDQSEIIMNGRGWEAKARKKGIEQGCGRS